MSTITDVTTVNYCANQEEIPLTNCTSMLVSKVDAAKERIAKSFDAMPKVMLGDEDEGEIEAADVEKGEKPAKDKTKKKPNRAPFGKKQWAWLMGGTGLVTLLSYMYRDQPLVAAAMMGGWIDLWRVAYRGMEDDGMEKTAVRCFGLFCLYMASVSYLYTPTDSAWNAIPWFAMAMAIFVKCEFNNLQLDKKVAEKLEIGANPAKFLTNGVQVACGTILANPNMPALVAGPSAIVAKGKAREMVNIVFEKMLAIEDKDARNQALALTYLALPIMAGGSYVALRSGSVTNLAGVIGLTFVNSASVDTTMRLFKSFLWKLVEEEAKPEKAKKEKKDNKEKAPKVKKIEDNAAWKKGITFLKEAPKGVAFLAAALAATTFVEKVVLDPTIPIGLSAALAGEVNTIFKPLSTLVGSSALEYNLLALTALTFGTKDFGLMRALLVDITMYWFKKGVRRDKIEVKEKADKAPKMDKAPKLPKTLIATL